jgi:Holliday junction DNA helicase RuvA
MIAKLSGVVDATGEGWAIIDVGGVGYLVFCSGRTLAHLSAGAPVRLWVETLMREDAIHLYGFADVAEREWFRLLNTVQGVGAKAALAVLSVLAPEQLTLAIAAGNRGAITMAPGVGQRLAGRIISELKERAPALPSTPAAPLSGRTAGAVPESDLGDAVTALVQLGFRPSEAMTAVSDAAGRLGADAGLEALIRDGLAVLAPKEQSS